MQFTNAAQFSAFSKVNKFALGSLHNGYHQSSNYVSGQRAKCGGSVDRFPENL